MAKTKFEYIGRQSLYYRVEVCAETREEADKIYDAMGAGDMEEFGEYEWETVEANEEEECGD